MTVATAATAVRAQHGSNAPVSRPRSRRRSVDLTGPCDPVRLTEFAASGNCYVQNLRSGVLTCCGRDLLAACALAERILGRKLESDEVRGLWKGDAPQST